MAEVVIVEPVSSGRVKNEQRADEPQSPDLLRVSEKGGSSRISFAEGGSEREVSPIANPPNAAHFSEIVAGSHDPSLADNFLKTSRYSILTFLPLNLFEQFHQISNCYFLLNMVIALLPGVSPIAPITAVMPLILVLFVAACKDGYEDWKRHKADQRDNASPVEVLRNGKWATVKSKDVRTGDIMLLSRGSPVKADVAILASDDPEGIVYIETAQLDGETSVKPRKALVETSHLTSLSLLNDATSGGAMKLRVDLPNDKLYRWQGVIYLRDGSSYPLSLKQTIWRGSSIRKTEWAHCIVIYAGHSTKQGMNLRSRTTRKLSSLLVKLNALIGIIFGIKHVFIFLLSGLSIGWAEGKWEGGSGHWYAAYWVDSFSSFERFWLNYLTYFILFSFLIPISLFVTIEICKACQILLMSMDQAMMYPNPADPSDWLTCRPKTSDLNEQLAVVRYIFSDKTGTLTENIMKYVAGVVNNGHDGWIQHKAGSGSDQSFDDEGAAYLDLDPEARYLASLALCHTVVPFLNKDKKGYIFEGASPDEVALVSEARDCGIVLTKRTAKEVELDVRGRRRKFSVLAELEFTPTRKMMSVVLQEEGTEVVLLLSKGADASVLPRVPEAHLSPAAREEVLQYLTDFSSTGLRTLCYGWKRIPVGEWGAWHRTFLAHQLDLAKTDAATDTVCGLIEKDLQFVGVSAYEDKLQEEVPETVRFFVNAGVVVWMLTGDKLETGVEIGKICGLADGADVFPVTLGKSAGAVGSADDRRVSNTLFIRERLEAALAAAKSSPTSLAIDGLALDVVMHATGEDLIPLFVELSDNIRSAMCCRLTPSQKGDIVQLFKKHSGTTALAIGDGANDSAMIGAASVGIGIIGLEGSQAELASDYAIPRFRHLKRLLVVHGRYALYRNAFCICFSFYKNLVLTMCQVYFAFYSGFTGQTVFDGWLLAVKNTLFTSLPPLLIGCFEKDLQEQALEDPSKGPELYRQLSSGLYFDSRTIIRWFVNAFFHGTLIFLTLKSHLELGDSDTSDGKITGLHTSGTLMLACVVYCVITKALLHMRTITSIQIGGIVFSLFLYPVFLVLYSAIKDLWGQTHFYKLAWYLFEDPKLYLFSLLSSVGFISVFDYAALFLQRQERPTLRDRIQDSYPFSEDTLKLPFFGCSATKQRTNKVQIFPDNEEPPDKAPR